MALPVPVLRRPGARDLLLVAVLAALAALPLLGLDGPLRKRLDRLLPSSAGTGPGLTP